MRRTVQFNEECYDIQTDESLLQCLLRNDIAYPNACQAGICQSCLIKSKDDDINPDWQIGLPETLKMQGYFLACLARPKTNLKVVKPDSEECEYDSRILAITPLNHNVLQLKIETTSLASWIPGQYVNLVNSEFTARSYSIANIPHQDGYIELHVKVNAAGSMGNWLLNKANNDSEIKLRGPFGRCFYHNPDQLAFDMLLAGTGTGLAPLVAIIKSALSLRHQGNITLVHGGLTDDDIYYREEMEALSLQYKSFVYDPCVLQSKGKYPVASIDKRVLMHLCEPKKMQVYVCGPKDTTDKLKKQIFLAGVPSKAILSDIFL